MANYQSAPAASPTPAASTHPYPATPVLAVVVAGELSVEVEAEEDISPGPAQAACSSAFPVAHSYAEVEAGIQADSYWVLERGMLVAAVVGEGLVGLWWPLRRRSQGLRLRQDP